MSATTWDLFSSPPETAYHLYQRIEDEFWGAEGFIDAEAHQDGLLLVGADGREWWLTAVEQA